MAMYEVKNETKNSFKFFNKTMNDNAIANLLLEHELRIGIKDDQLRLYYQPQLESGRIIGLEALKIENSNVTIYSDSKYVVDSVEKGWIWNWVKTRFKGKKNEDLWLRFLKIYPKHKVKFVWVKGHANIPETDRCDQLAVEASMQPRLQKDQGYLLNRE